jgi:hypothetical protein
MKFPKDKRSMFLQLSEFDCIQINVSVGRIYHYWWIEPSIKPIKLIKGEVPTKLKNHDLSNLSL